MFIEFSQCQGPGATAVERPETGSEGKGQGRRKQWAEPSHSVLQKLADASVLSSDSLASHGSMTHAGAA